MGLFSKIKKGLSKAWKGVKKTVKKVAKGVKKVAKKVAYALPGGKALWKAGGKLGREVMKGIGKLGPVGIMAAQVVLSSTGLGAGLAASLSSVWSSMGATAAAAAANGSILGSVANAAWNAANWVGGSLGAVGDAFTQGAKNLMSGSFSKAAETFGSNMMQAFTGEAGKTAVNTAINKATESALASAAGQSVMDQAIAAGSNALANSGGTLANLGTATDASALVSQGPAPFDPMAKSTPDLLKAGPTSASSVPAFDVEKAAAAAQPWYSGAIETGKEVLKEQGKEVLKSTAKSLLSPSSGQQSGGYAPIYNEYAPMAQGQALSDPTVSKAIQAVKVDGQRNPYSYYNPTQFA